MATVASTTSGDFFENKTEQALVMSQWGRHTQKYTVPYM